MFILRCKVLDWVGVKHFLDVSGGNRDSSVTFEGSERASPVVSLADQDRKSTLPRDVKANNTVSLPHKHMGRVPTTKPTVMLVSPHSPEGPCVPGCHSEGPRLGGIQQTRHPAASYPQG